MDDMISRLSEVLDNPEQAEKIKRIAASMMSGSDGEKNVSTEGNNNVSSDENTEAIAVSVPQTQNSRSFEKLFANMNCSKNVALLNAIRPYMRSSRAEKIGSAIKAMEMIELLSKLK